MSRTEKLLDALYAELNLVRNCGDVKRITEIQAQISLILRDQALRFECGLVA